MTTANTKPSAKRRRTAIAVAAAAALTGILAGCGHSGTHAAATPQAKTSTAAAAATAATAAARPAPGLHMVTDQGHRLAFHVTPGHLPAIVLDAGGGLDSSYWKDVVPVLAKQTGSEIITYDREGMGASDEVPGPWKVGNAVADLEAGLTALHADQGVVLVAHSEAGEIATEFARQYPGQVAGAVLVDASLPQFYTDTEITRIAGATQAQVDALKGKATTKADRQLLAVAADYVPAHQAYHKVSWPAGVPATVIVSAQTPFPTSPPDAQAWRDAQAAFAKAAQNRQLVVAANSSHDVPLDRADVVEAQVAAMVKTLG